jgi:diguanylate cyclase (GGDEF)-like protein/PAS domain S-box-containing protein
MTENVSLPPASILLVGSSQSLAEVLDHLLTRSGYVVTVEENDQEALTTLTQGRFDLSILDLQRPEVGGLQLVKDIRRTDSLQEMPLVVIAGENQTSEIVEALSLGASDCVTVPLDFPVALARIKARLASKPALQRLTPEETLLYYQLESSDEGSLWVSPQDAWVSFNQRFLKMFTLPEELVQDTVNRKGFGLILGQLKQPEAFLEIVSRLSTNKEDKSWDEIALNDGRTFDCYSTPIKNTEEIYMGRVWYFRDVTGTKWAEEAQFEAEEALRESEERYSLAALGANDGLWDWDLRSNRIYYSSRWKSMLGYEEAEIGTSLDEWFKRVRPEDLGRVKEALKSHLKGKSSHFECEYRMLHKDGTSLWVLSRGLAVRNPRRQVTRVAGSQTDITQSKVADPLTGLPNRLLVTDRLRQMIERSRRSKDFVFAFLVLDIDRFKLINDSLGHLAGDELLVGIGRRIEACLRATDTVARYTERHVVAHLAGDQFTVLLENIKHVGNAIRIVDRIQNELSPPFSLNGQEIFVSASMGIAISATGYDKPEDIMRDADTALNRAKAQGKAGYQIFDPAMHEEAVTRMKIESLLRKGLEREQFRNFYQPIVSLDTRRVVGFEVLVRLKQDDHTLITPGDFIPVAEETGIILPLGLWILREACHQMRTWQMQFSDRCPKTISVNLSAKFFVRPDLIERIDEILRESGLEPQNLRLEITESQIIDNVESAVQVLSQLKAKGIHLSMDDFGTGYSSLSYLHRLPVDTLKIDRSFVSQLGPSGENSEIIRTIVLLARNLGLDVVAEGVETAEQLAQLQAIGCEYGQGYFFARPLDAESAGRIVGGILPV